MILEQGAIIGISIAAVLLGILIFMIVLCCVCTKCERCCLKKSLKRQERKYEDRKTTLTDEQIDRKSKLKEKHDEIRRKYGLAKPEGFVKQVDETSPKI